MRGKSKTIGNQRTRLTIKPLLGTYLSILLTRKTNKAMTIIKCPKCKGDVKIDIAKCIDEEGEVHRCPHCGMIFRYAER